MPRIRTIKPELFKHEELYDLEAETGLPIRVSFIGLFTIADREGRFKWRPRSIKAEVLPHDDVDFSRVLDALVTRGFLVKYACGTDVFGCIPTFKKHQVINNREAPSDLPGPDDNSSEIQDVDACGTREAREGHASKAERKGKEGKGRERKGREGVPPADACVLAVFDHWRVVMSHQNAKLDSKRAKLIQGAINLGYTESDLKTAIDGCKSSAWHMGRNDRATVYDGLDLILRDASHIDKFVRMAAEHQFGDLSPNGQITARNAMEWIQESSHG